MLIQKPPRASWSRLLTRQTPGRTYLHRTAQRAVPVRELKGTPAEYGAGLKLAIARGWLELHRSGTFVKFTQTGADLFALLFTTFNSHFLP